MPDTELIEATATVIAIEKDMAVLETIRTNACSGCGVSGACGTSTLGDLFGRKRNLLHVKNSFDAVPGEQVIIGLPETELVLASLAAYMVPLGAMIALALIALALGFGDGVAGLAAIAGLAAGLVFAGRITKNAGVRFAPQYLRRSAVSFAIDGCGK